MTQETIERLEMELRQSYEGVTSTRDGPRTFVRLPLVHFPSGCEPSSTSALVAFDPDKPKPEFYLKVIPSVRGAKPQHGAAVVCAEDWCRFSYDLRWDEQQHSALQFV